MTVRAVASLDAMLVEGTWSGSILSIIEFLDSNLGAAYWGTRQIAFGSVIFLAIIRAWFKESYGVNWYPFIHGAASGYLSAMAVWISVFASVTLTGSPEPLRSIECQGPLTSLHRIVPAITMGYGLFDILDGFSHGIDFVRRFDAL